MAELTFHRPVVKNRLSINFFRNDYRVTRAPTLIQFSSSPRKACRIAQMPLTGFEPVASPLPRECATPAPQRLISQGEEKPAIGIEPTTYGLQNRCSTVELCRRVMC